MFITILNFSLSFTSGLPSYIAWRYCFWSFLNQLQLIPAADLNSPYKNRIAQWQSIFLTEHFAQSRGISRSIDNRKAQFFEIEFNSYFCMTAILVSHNKFLFRSYLPQSLDSDNVLANASEMTATTAEGKNDCPLGLFCYHLWVCHCHRPHSRYKLKLFPTKTHL